MRKVSKVIMTAAVGMTTAALVLGASTAQASDSGLYGTLTDIYNQASGTVNAVASGQTNLGSAVTSVAQSAGSVISGGTGTGTGSAGATGGVATVNGRRVITYYPVYNMQSQQAANLQQQLNQQLQQFYNGAGGSYYVNANGVVTDVSGNSVGGTGTSGDVSGNALTQSALDSTIRQIQSALTPDIAALESDPVGPIVAAAGLAESYHENYQIYEERFSDLYAIYTNIPSGSITNRPAIFDVPNGVSVRMTRDGKEVGFANKEQIKTEGTYVIQFYVLQDGSEDLPAWQQTVERGRFTFRIQYTAGLDGTPLEAVSDQSELQSFADLVQGESEVLLPGDVEELGGEELTPDNEESGETGESGETAEEATGIGKQPTDIVSATGGLSTAWDEDAGYYRMTLLTGDSFTSNIPDGMVTNSSALFLPEGDVRMELYRGAEQIDYTAGDFITEAGDYTLIPVVDNLDYESYYRMNRPMMRFRVVTGAVNDLGAFTAPEATEISAVRLGGEDVTERVMLTDKTAALSEDGAWEVDLTGEGGIQTVYITRDTTPPAVSVTTEPNAAHISYLSEDIAGATLTRGSELISDGQLVTLVTDAGRYQLTVRDTAGNETGTEFSVQYRINAFAIIAIVAVVALIGALLIFLRRVKTSVRVR